LIRLNPVTRFRPELRESIASIGLAGSIEHLEIIVAVAKGELQEGTEAALKDVERFYLAVKNLASIWSAMGPAAHDIAVVRLASGYTPSDVQHLLDELKAFGARAQYGIEKEFGAPDEMEKKRGAPPKIPQNYLRDDLVWLLEEQRLPVNEKADGLLCKLLESLLPEIGVDDFDLPELARRLARNRRNT